VDDPAERIKQLYAIREPIYQESGTVILTDQRPLKDIVSHVIRIWERESVEFARSKT